jgi:WD40 repeat protein
VLEVKSGREVRTLEGHRREVYSVAVTPDGRLALSANRDQTLTVWDVETGHELRTLQGHSHYVNKDSLSADGRFAVSASDDTTLKVWDVETGALIVTFTCDAEVPTVNSLPITNSSPAMPAVTSTSSASKPRRTAMQRLNASRGGPSGIGEEPCSDRQRGPETGNVGDRVVDLLEADFWPESVRVRPRA